MLQQELMPFPFSCQLLYWLLLKCFAKIFILCASVSPHVAPRFRLVPFLVELRAVMDWVWTDTTLSLSNWMCVEDIYANIFIIKCSRETEKVWRPFSICVLITVVYILAGSPSYSVSLFNMFTSCLSV